VGTTVLCAATRDHWRDPSRLAWVQSCVEEIATICNTRGTDRMALPTVAIPPLGCGLGGLSWVDVRPLIVATFAHHPTRAIVYEP
jgi:hypothetical protein